MKQALQFNMVGTRKAASSILVVHGTKDDIVHPEETKKLHPPCAGGRRGVAAEPRQYQPESENVPA
jgi:hypothetical protein